MLWSKENWKYYIVAILVAIVMAWGAAGLTYKPLPVQVPAVPVAAPPAPAIPTIAPSVTVTGPVPVAPAPVVVTTAPLPTITPTPEQTEDLYRCSGYETSNLYGVVSQTSCVAQLVSATLIDGFSMGLMFLLLGTAFMLVGSLFRWFVGRGPRR